MGVKIGEEKLLKKSFMDQNGDMLIMANVYVAFTVH